MGVWGRAMTLFSQFSISLGASLALQAVIVGWLFRTTTAPIWQKIVLPTLAVFLACWTPYSAASMFGYPVSVAMSALPDHAELIAFVPHDAAGTVDLWLRTDDAPRAYETRLTAAMKKTLEAAREEQARGGIAMLVKKGRKGSSKAGDPLGIGDNSDLYVLDPSALMSLPPKE